MVKGRSDVLAAGFSEASADNGSRAVNKEHASHHRRPGSDVAFSIIMSFLHRFVTVRRPNVGRL
jgi:hypothetical protein